MTALKIWIEASRPRTLGAAAAPVIIGTAMAAEYATVQWLIAMITLAAALLIQIGTNFANDYFDCIKGADTEERTGPVRATQAGLVSPEMMKNAFLITFALAALCGLFLVYKGGLPILIIGILSILFGILYTGGPYPLGYNGLADIFVMIFFGFIAVGGTFYLQTSSINYTVVIAGAAPGFFSTAILTVNNLRDIDTDMAAGKRTLAVRFGKNFAKAEYLICILGASIVPVVLFIITQNHPFTPFSSIIAIPGLFLVKKVFTQEGEKLNAVLASTGKLLLLFSIVFSAGWLI